ncbi:hypothetical protein GCM10010424_63520 [Streptomyces lienomycini]
MTDLSTRDGAATGTGDRSRPRAALPALCLTQIVSWGIVYCAFPVLNPQITAATGWAAGATTAAFSLGLSSPPSLASASGASSTVAARAPS